MVVVMVVLVGHSIPKKDSRVRLKKLLSVVVNLHEGKNALYRQQQQ